MEGTTPPQPPIPPLPSHAVELPPTYYDTEAVNTRPCHGCGGQLEFDIKAQKLGCPHCGATEDIVHAEGAEVRERSYMEALAAGHGLGNAYQKNASGEKEIICSSCGGHTTFVGTLTTTRCPYCATSIQRTDVHDAPDRLAVDGVLPFQITDDKAQELLMAWIDKRWFAPNEFKKYGLAGSFQSVYAAYFTYDADATTNYRGQRGDTHTRTVGSGDNRRTVTETHWRPASGRVFNKFDDVTILANTGFNDRYVAALDPWPAKSIQPFNPDYLAGHLARTYDRSAEECMVSARSIMDGQIDTTIRSDIGGDDQKITSKNTRMANVKYKHVLLPIWLLTVLYNGEPWQVFMNGATGEIHGRRPWSQVKIAATIAAVIFLIVLLVVLKSVLS